MKPIEIVSSPEQTPTHGATKALSVVVLSSDDDTLIPSKPSCLFPKNVVELDSSDDDMVLINIQRIRNERAAILNRHEDTVPIEFKNTDNVVPGALDQMQTALNEKTLKESTKLKEKIAKIAEKEHQKLMKKVNHKRDKHATAKEMVVEISKDLMNRNGEELVALLQEIDVECIYSNNPLPCSLLFKRKVDRLWNDDTECWEPCKVFIEREHFIILQLDAFEFAAAVNNGLSGYHQRIKSHFPNFKIIYIIEDLNVYYEEKKKVLDRQMRENVSGAQETARISKKAQEREKYLAGLPNESVIEEQLLWLQFQSKGDIFIHHSKKNDTASWIKTFIVEIGLIPEWKHRNEEFLDVQFGEQIKSGKNFKDTWQKMLQCIPFVTEAKAEAIVEKYPTFNSLYSVYLSISQKDGESLLTAINLGGTTSKRIYDAFMSRSAQSNFLTK